MRAERKLRIIEEVVPPTPETVSKLRPDNLAHLPNELRFAADQIQDAWAALTLGLNIKINSLTQIGKAIMPPELSNRLAWLIVYYKKWREEMKRLNMNDNAVIEIIVDGYTCKEISAKYKRRNSWAYELLSDSLKLYNDLKNK